MSPAVRKIVTIVEETVSEMAGRSIRRRGAPPHWR